jgi:hypothetical protein
VETTAIGNLGTSWYDILTVMRAVLTQPAEFPEKRAERRAERRDFGPGGGEVISKALVGNVDIMIAGIDGGPCSGDIVMDSHSRF